MEPNKSAKRKVWVYRVYENGKKELIGCVTSPFEAIDIAAKHSHEIKGTTITIGSEPEATDIDERCTC